MRNFWIATILFIILLTATVSNSFFICLRSNDLRTLAQDIPSVDSKECLRHLITLDSEWRNFRRVASLTVSYSELNKISCTINELYVHLKNKNKVDFDHGLCVLINALSEISRSERFSFESIF